MNLRLIESLVTSLVWFEPSCVLVKAVLTQKKVRTLKVLWVRVAGGTLCHYKNNGHYGNGTCTRESLSHPYWDIGRLHALSPLHSALGLIRIQSWSQRRPAGTAMTLQDLGDDRCSGPLCILVSSYKYVAMLHVPQIMMEY